ncbi:MAG TPA: glycerate kinase [Draconibacterium sp.]|nr:glycerate kinase [Draconibacterium sp.]
MNILVAPNSMKGSLNAFDFAETVERALIHYSSEINVRKVPVADGGDFTGEVIARALNAETVYIKVQGPLGKRVNSKYFVSGKTAIIEMADASGMKMVEKHELNPLKALSVGTGELIADAILKGSDEILLAVGGSATVDGGMGMMEALGFHFFDENGNELSGNGLNLLKVFDISFPKAIPEISMKIICDVENPLLGENGAAAVFGPQKGATPEMVIQLETGLRNWSQVLQKKTGKSITDQPGTGAAGGVSIPLISFYGAEIVRGADFVLSLLNFDEHIKWADLVITGEGKLDAQTLNNKAPFAVAYWTKKQNKPVFAFGGSVEKEAAVAFDGIFSISNESMDLEFAMKNARQLLYNFTLEFAGNLENLVKVSNEK